MPKRHGQAVLFWASAALWAPLRLLAQSGSSTSGNPGAPAARPAPAGWNLYDLPWWVIIVLVLVAMVGAVLAYKWARRLLNPDDGGEVAFSLSDLRRLRDEGVMTSEEFDRAKAALIARERRVLEKPEAGESGEEGRV